METPLPRSLHLKTMQFLSLATLVTAEWCCSGLQYLAIFSTCFGVFPTCLQLHQRLADPI